MDERNDQVRISLVSEHAGVVTGRMRGHHRARGVEQAFAVRYTMEWVREYGAWRIRRERWTWIES